jgi:hypothetical protein
LARVVDQLVRRDRFLGSEDLRALKSGSRTGLVSWAKTDTLARAVATPASYYRATLAADDTAPSRPQGVELRGNRSKINIRTSPTIQIP